MCHLLIWCINQWNHGISHYVFMVIKGGCAYNLSFMFLFFSNVCFGHYTVHMMDLIFISITSISSERCHCGWRIWALWDIEDISDPRALWSQHSHCVTLDMTVGTPGLDAVILRNRQDTQSIAIRQDTQSIVVFVVILLCQFLGWCLCFCLFFCASSWDGRPLFYFDECNMHCIII